MTRKNSWVIKYEFPLLISLNKKSEISLFYVLRIWVDFITRRTKSESNSENLWRLWQLLTDFDSEWLEMHSWNRFNFTYDTQDQWQVMMDAVKNWTWWIKQWQRRVLLWNFYMFKSVYRPGDCTQCVLLSESWRVMKGSF